MNIKYHKKSNRILSISKSGVIGKADQVIAINDSELPKDFMKTFGLGKYLIKKGKLIKNNKFVMPGKKSPQEKIEI